MYRDPPRSAFPHILDELEPRFGFHFHTNGKPHSLEGEPLRLADPDQQSVDALQELIDAAADRMDDFPPDPGPARPAAEASAPQDATPEYLIDIEAALSGNDVTPQPADIITVVVTTPGHSGASQSSREHWMTSMMSCSSKFAPTPTDTVEQESEPHAVPNTHWVSCAMATASEQGRHARASLDQWLYGSPPIQCAPMQTIPVTSDLPAAATGQTTMLEPYAIYPNKDFELGRLSGHAFAASSTMQTAAAISPADRSQGPATAVAFEDSTAELLRPLLRQWVDENMGLMMQKALSAEVAGKPHH